MKPERCQNLLCTQRCSDSWYVTQFPQLSKLSSPRWQLSGRLLAHPPEWSFMVTELVWALREKLCSLSVTALPLDRLPASQLEGETR